MLLYDVHTHVGADQGFLLRGWWPYASTTTDLLGMHTDEFTEATQVSRSLDVIRGVFADLDALDRSVRSGSPRDQA